MRTIELPESVYRRAEQAARERGVTVDEFLLRTFERALTGEAESKANGRRVALPLISSKQPGTLDLKDFNFDDLLA